MLALLAVQVNLFFFYVNYERASTAYNNNRKEAYNIGSNEVERQKGIEEESRKDLRIGFYNLLPSLLGSTLPSFCCLLLSKWVVLNARHQLHDKQKGTKN